jgi:hypothetical protein
MSLPLSRRGAVALFVSSVTAALAVSPAIGASKLEVQVAKLEAIHEVQNLMTRYAQDNWNEQFDDLMEVIAMDKPDVHINVPNPLVGGAAIRKGYESRMQNRAAGKGMSGQMHVHPNLSPYVVVADDLQTARGIWDSFAPDIQNGDVAGTWVYSRYAVDFINDKGVWKIWHLQLYPVIGASSDKTLVAGARERAAQSAQQAAQPNYKPTMLPTGGGKSVALWRYSGVGDTPQNYPPLPKPYKTFDPKDSF